MLENLCFCLADAGDAILIPTPYYAAFEFDCCARAALTVEAVTTEAYHHPPAVPQQEEAGDSSEDASSTTSSTASNSSSSNNDSDSSSSSSFLLDPTVYYPNRAALDAAYERAAAKGHPPKILLLSHPMNPLGICYPADTVQECIDWCRERRVHLIADEIYAGSVHSPSAADNSRADTGFRSVLSLAGPDALGPYVHWVYALSKDFALSGLRVGASYSENPEIRQPLQKLNDLCQISSQTQVWTARTLERRMKSSGSGSSDKVKSGSPPAGACTTSASASARRPSRPCWTGTGSPTCRPRPVSLCGWICRNFCRTTPRSANARSTSSWSGSLASS